MLPTNCAIFAAVASCGIINEVGNFSLVNEAKSNGNSNASLTIFFTARTKQNLPGQRSSKGSSILHHAGIFFARLEGV
jgi:hypothetical protein